MECLSCLHEQLMCTLFDCKPPLVMVEVMEGLLKQKPTEEDMHAFLVKILRTIVTRTSTRTSLDEQVQQVPENQPQVEETPQLGDTPDQASADSSEWTAYSGTSKYSKDMVVCKPVSPCSVHFNRVHDNQSVSHCKRLHCTLTFSMFVSKSSSLQKLSLRVVKLPVAIVAPNKAATAAPHLLSNRLRTTTFHPTARRYVASGTILM